MELKKLAAYLPYKPQFHLPFDYSSDRFSSMLENHPLRLCLAYMDEQDIKKQLKEYHSVVLTQSEPALMWDDGELFLGQMKSNLGFEEDDVYLKEVKLVLKPLFDLIDNILEDGNDSNYELSLQLSDLLNTNDCSNFVKALIENKYYAVDVRLWNDIEEWLYKNHFDWRFGLIEKGESIDINTLDL